MTSHLHCGRTDGYHVHLCLTSKENISRARGKDFSAGYLDSFNQTMKELRDRTLAGENWEPWLIL